MNRGAIADGRTGALCLGALLLSSGTGCLDGRVTVLERIAPTYHEDVTPILARHCWCCHQPGGPAHPLTALAEVEAELTAIVEDIDARTMPPAAMALPCGAAPLPGGLSQEERSVLAAWIEGGRPRGFAGAAAEVPPRCGLPESELHSVDLRHTPAEGSPETRCFPLPALEGFSTGVQVSGLQVRASSRAVRSVLLLGVEGSPGFPAEGLGDDCHSQRALGTALASWSVEAGGVVLPAGVGATAAGALYARIATDPAYGSTAGEVVTTLEVGLREAVAPAAVWTTAIPPVFELPARTAETEVEGKAHLSANRRLLGVSALAHDLATRVSFSVMRGEQESCVAEIQPWPRAGIGSWLLSAPLAVAADDWLIVRCRYDTSDRPEPVPAADPPDGELCWGGFLLAP